LKNTARVSALRTSPFIQPGIRAAQADALQPISMNGAFNRA
jgi:hypothetical protein